MLRTVRDAPHCPKAGVDYPVLRTVKSVQTFGGPAVVGSIRVFLSVIQEARASKARVVESER